MAHVPHALRGHRRRDGVVPEQRAELLRFVGVVLLRREGQQDDAQPAVRGGERGCEVLDAVEGAVAVVPGEVGFVAPLQAADEGFAFGAWLADQAVGVAF